MIKRDIFGGSVKEQLRAAGRDRLYRFMMAGGKLRGGVVHATRMVREMRANHDLDILETLILGQAYIAGALLTANLKGKDRVSLQVQCSGPVKGLDVEANVFGEVRGFIKNTNLSADHGGELKSSLSPLFGAGFLTVTKYLEEAKKPYSGQVVLEYGSIAEDLANYFLQSEQTPTAFTLSVHFDGSGEVAGAGGLFLQAMPGAQEEQLLAAEDRVRDLASLGELLAEGHEPDTLILQRFEDLNPILLGNHRVEFFCRCSEEGMKAYLACLPKNDMDDILKNGPFPLEIRCHHCNTVYTFDREALIQGLA